uniref:Uncharacterized protein n=1 Tax=Timema douglasi TaxID=61478 RepID=A0A7R8Z8Q7_TIMDO|nr:unnamed protein product [Timema douglasi]
MVSNTINPLRWPHALTCYSRVRLDCQRREDRGSIPSDNLGSRPFHCALKYQLVEESTRSQKTVLCARHNNRLIASTAHAPPAILVNILRFFLSQQPEDWFDVISMHLELGIHSALRLVTNSKNEQQDDAVVIGLSTAKAQGLRRLLPSFSRKRSIKTGFEHHKHCWRLAALRVADDKRFSLLHPTIFPLRSRGKREFLTRNAREISPPPRLFSFSFYNTLDFFGARQTRQAQ